MKVKVEKQTNQTVLEYLVKRGIKLLMPCGGRGTCGKCKVKVVKGKANISDADKNFFSEKQLEEGYRLGCQLIASEDMEIEIETEKDKDFRIVSSYESMGDTSSKKLGSGYGVGIDIGTTTIAMELIHLDNGEICAAYTTLNSQRQYGADVITRINFSAMGGVGELQKCVQQDILNGLERLCELAGIQSNLINEVVIAGNTTMLHTLMGLNCKSLGEYPFTPVILDLMKLKFKEVFKDSKIEASLTLIPGIGTYVGADIVSGLYHCQMNNAVGIKLFIDIGTNGEMAIGTKDNIISLAAAAGPAFEGGNISCGVGSIRGAISDIVSYEDGQFICNTIGQVPPTGICGSGLIQLMALCIKKGLIDESGYIVDESEKIIIYDKEDIHISLTQKDVRQVQLAKAAIRAGVETLIHMYQVKYEDIEEVYLAGGFGKYLDPQSMTTLGLIPKALEGKIVKVGNSALGGCMKYFLDEKNNLNLEMIRKKSKAINLSESIEFNELFVEHMMF